MSSDAQAVFYFLALLCFATGAVFHLTRNAWPSTLLYVGLALWVFVPFWIALNG